MCATQLSFPILQNHHCCFRLLSKTSNEVSEALVKQPVDKWIYSHTEPTHIDRELAPDWEHDPRRDPACTRSVDFLADQCRWLDLFLVKKYDFQSKNNYFSVPVAGSTRNNYSE